MADPTPAITLPEWVGYMSTAIGAGIVYAVAKLGKKDGTQDKANAGKVGAVMAMQPSAQRYTDDALVQTLAALRVSVDKLTELLERQEREREEDERAELRELRRIVKDIRAQER